MLGKLIKHEWKAVCKPLFFIQLAMVIMTIVGVVLLMIEPIKDQILIMIILAMVYILSAIAIAFGTQIYLAYRFYKNMYTDEGYLSHTLPVEPWMHIVSKGLVAMIWIFIQNIILIGSILTLVWCASRGIEGLEKIDFSDLSVAISQINPSEITGAVIYCIEIVVLGVLGLVMQPLMYYFSISIGQLFKSHKLLAGVIAYVVILNVQRVIASTIQIVTMLSSNFTSDDESVFATMLNPVMGGNIILIAVFCVVFFFGTNFIMKKKLNLA